MQELIAGLRALADFVGTITVQVVPNEKDPEFQQDAADVERTKAKFATWAENARRAAELLERTVIIPIPVDCGRANCEVCAARRDAEKAVKRLHDDTPESC